MTTQSSAIMKARFEAGQHKLFNHILACLARFGEKLSLLCLLEGEKEHVIRLSTISSSQSAFCAFFLLPTFFETYEMDPVKKRFDLHIPIKNMQAVMRYQLNKRLHFCEMNLMENGPECRLAVRLHGAQGTIRTHKLTFEASPCLFPRDTASSVNRIVVHSKTIQTLLDFFIAKSSGDITMMCSSECIILRSKGDDIMDPSAAKRTLQTEVKVEKRAFLTYEVGQPTELTFGLREFRATISLADHLQCPLELLFDTAGYPISIFIHAPDITGHVFISTSVADQAAEADEQSETGQGYRQSDAGRGQDGRANESTLDQAHGQGRRHEDEDGMERHDESADLSYDNNRASYEGSEDEEEEEDDDDDDEFEGAHGDQSGKRIRYNPIF